MAWLTRGIRPEPGPAVLRGNRLYILPSRQGMVVGMVLLVMLLGSLNYALSLGFAFTFLVGGVYFLSIFHAYRNLLGLRLTAGRPEPAFAGGEALFPITLEGRGQERWALGLKLLDGEPLYTDLESDRSLTVELRRPAPRRGRLPMGRIALFTEYPLGAIRCWSYVELTVSTLVYPAPEAEGRAPLPAVVETALGVEGKLVGDSGDFSGLRPYQEGDSPRGVHWPVYARTGVLATKRFTCDGHGEIWLDWEATRGLGDPEARLSRLCRWILTAEAMEIPHGLRLPGGEIPPGRGEIHQRLCLEALALFGESTVGRTGP
ncbi:MAG: DUF58 domain-containing protein [Magnetococcales bacterium]|nr:DUF58 domain-containing protein [Magnetococcales bacterium]